jgi:hypothetical protein
MFCFKHLQLNHPDQEHPSLDVDFDPGMLDITMASMTESIMIKGGRLLQKKVENISGSWRIGSHKANKTLGAYRKGSIPFSCNNAAF